MMNVGIGHYRPKDYLKIYNMSEDKETMNETWKEWKKKKDKAKAGLEKQGLHVVDVLVFPKELKKYCEEQGIKIDGKARSKFVSYKLLINSVNN